MASSRSQASHAGETAPRFRTGIAALGRDAKRHASAAHHRAHRETTHTTASTRRSRFGTKHHDSGVALACNFRTAGEQRFQAGCRRAAMSKEAESAERDSVRQSGPACPL